MNKVKCFKKIAGNQKANALTKMAKINTDLVSLIYKEEKEEKQVL